jgi:hypothetical protein
MARPLRNARTATAHTRQVVSLLALDIAGAFDIVMRNRLILRLREQGWPPSSSVTKNHPSFP